MIRNQPQQPVPSCAQDTLASSNASTVAASTALGRLKRVPMDALGTEKQQEPSVASYPTSHSLSHAEAATTPVAAAAQLEATADGRAAASTASRDSFYAAFPPTAEATLLSPVVESARTCSVPAQRRNVMLSFGFTILSTLFLSCAQGPIFDMYIFLLGNHSNKWVGNTESLSGIVSLIVAAPVGLLVDKWPKDIICKAVCIVGLLASVLSFWGVSTNSFLLIIPSLILWGLFYEASNGATGAIFTDSLTRGQRTKWFSWKGMMQSASTALSPLLMAGFFNAYGDSWDLARLRLLILLGIIFFGPSSSLLLWFFIDLYRVRPCTPAFASKRWPAWNGGKGVWRLSSSQRRHNRIAAPTDNFPSTTNDSSSSGSRGIATADSVEEPMRRLLSATQEAPESSFSAASEEGDGAGPAAVNDEELSRSVPYIISISDFVRSMGAGMTVKFFPLFFSNDYNLSPIHLCLLSISYAFSVAIFIFFASTLSKHIGRALTSQLFSLLGLLALTAMCYLEDLRFLIAAHLLRGGMQNANYPLDRSMIVDFSKSTDRGKWSAMETFTSTLWSGSAFLGGILADKDYRYAFGVTAIVYAVAWLVYTPLVFIIPQAERAIGMPSGGHPSEIRPTQEREPASDSTPLIAAEAATQTPPTESESARNMESASLTDSPPIENWDCPDDAPFWRSREGSNLSAFEEDAPPYTSLGCTSLAWVVGTAV
ncbi:uncharacterized protein LOC34619204 [Cyclospora cayetanensis]|uniref:Uncharacterized protein LOC34619204 n=1 Tax=Cyclospora cayetanensis TaxID=88456 RepID=A0A6P6RRG6_9EIME|nr:uncharacterized protein LOC34619204 [Cyclospora cayetanensis]